MGRTGGWKSLVLFLSLAGTVEARAQAMTWMLGGGMTNSAADLSAMDVHGMAGVTFALKGSLGFRADALLSAVPQGAMLAATGNIVLGLVPGEEEFKGFYGFGGGGVVLVGGETRVGLNGGGGIRFPINDAMGVFLEGRYYRILGGTGNPDMLTATIGLEFRVH